MKRIVLENLMKKNVNVVKRYEVESGCVKCWFHDGVEGKGKIGNNQKKLTIVCNDDSIRTLFDDINKGYCKEYKVV